MAMHTSARSSPGATQSAAGLHAPALSDLSGFLANVSHQIAALQYEMQQVKLHTGISFPPFNPDMEFAETIANHINGEPSEASQTGKIDTHFNSSASHRVTGNAGVDGPAVPSASAALRTSFAPIIATTRAPSPASSAPSEPFARTETPPGHGSIDRPVSAGCLNSGTRPVSGASVRSARPGSMRNIIVAAGDQSQILTLTQMVEQFEDRVEDRLEEMEVKLAAIEPSAQQVSSLEREVALLKSGVDNSSASAQEATQSAAALATELEEMRSDTRAAIKVLQQQVDPYSQKDAEMRAAAASASVEEMAKAHAQLQIRIREISGNVERMRADHRTMATQFSSLERQRGELANSLRRVEKDAKVELDEATSALHAKLGEALDGNKRAEDSLKALEERAVAWDGLKDVVQADAATAAAGREALKDSFAQEAAALATHLSNSDEKIKALKMRFNEAAVEVDRLSQSKQDCASAVTMEMVNRRVAAGINDATERHKHAERQLAAMQESIEELILTKADKGDIATASKLKAGLAEIQQNAAAAVKEGVDEVKALISSKAEAQLLRQIESEVARRFASLEAALLKGLQTVSDKAAGALDLKVPTTDFDRFRGVMNSRLHEIHRALGDLLPTARALGASGSNRATCLSCDQRVRTNSEIAHALHANGTGTVPEDSTLREQLSRAASPQRLPRTAPVGARKPISAADPVGASHNAWLASKSRKFASLHTNQKLSKQKQAGLPGQLGPRTPVDTSTAPILRDAITASSDIHQGWKTPQDTVRE